MFDIKTTLGICPAIRDTHELIYITRGASAILNFNFADTVYNFDDVNQITFSFKQGRKLFWYKMFTYLMPTDDETVVFGKTYYTDVRPIVDGCLQCSATVVCDPAEPKANNYYEAVEGNHSWSDTLYIIDEHFCHSVGKSWDYLTFSLAAEETAQFTCTQPGNYMEYEIAVRLNTYWYKNTGNRDSIIIEPQHPIAVIDSLYSKLV